MRKEFKEASLTVEATLAFPIFFFAVLVFLYLFQILYIQEHIQSTLVKMVEKTSKYAYIYENALSSKEAESVDGLQVGEEWVQNIMSDGFLAALFIKEADRDMLNHSCIQGGIMGIHFLSSSVMVDEKEIDAVAKYTVVIKVPILSFVSLPVCQRIKGRAFVGKSYAVKGQSEDGEETMVYVTPTGKAYHQYQNCTYINIVIQNETYQNVDSLRNEGGAKYYACERCVGMDLSNNTVVYISGYGTRFHTVRECPGIKRSVTAIPLSQVGDRHECGKCYQ